MLAPYFAKAGEAMHQPDNTVAIKQILADILYQDTNSRPGAASNQGLTTFNECTLIEQPQCLISRVNGQAATRL